MGLSRPLLRSFLFSTAWLSPYIFWNVGGEVFKFAAAPKLGWNSRPLRNFELRFFPLLSFGGKYERFFWISNLSPLLSSPFALTLFCGWYLCFWSKSSSFCLYHLHMRRAPSTLTEKICPPSSCWHTRHQWIPTAPTRHNHHPLPRKPGILVRKNEVQLPLEPTAMEIPNPSSGELRRHVQLVVRGKSDATSCSDTISQRKERSRARIVPWMGSNVWLKRVNGGSKNFPFLKIRGQCWCCVV